MVLQYKPKSGGKWRDWPGKAKFKGRIGEQVFRLLSHNKKKILVKSGTYSGVMKRFRQIEFFKNR